MGKAFSVAKKIVADAGSEGDVTIYVVEPARVFKLDEVQINFPPGQGFNLEISIFRGLSQVVPGKGVYCGDGCIIRDKSDEEFQSGERIMVHYKNNDTSSAQACFILLTGEFIS